MRKPIVYIPNGIRLKALVANFHGCVVYPKTLTSWSNKYYIISEYIIPIEEFLEPISDIEEEMAKQMYFANTGKVFYSILNTMVLLHEKEWLDDDMEKESPYSSSFVLNSVTLDDFGFREISGREN